jgi:hypothetical protein
MNAENKNKIITVAELIEFFKTIPADAKISVLRDVGDYYSSTKWGNAFNTGDNFDSIDGIDYNPNSNTVYFGDC